MQTVSILPMFFRGNAELSQDVFPHSEVFFCDVVNDRDPHPTTQENGRIEHILLV